MRSLVHIGLHGAVPLSLGSATYVLFRSRAIHGVALLDGAALDGARAVVAPLRAVLPDVVVFSLPDALWIYALVSALGALHRERAARIAWLAAAVVLGAGWELGQLAGVVAGTFDPVDLCLSLAAAALGWCVAERSHHTSGGA